MALLNIITIFLHRSGCTASPPRRSGCFAVVNQYFSVLAVSSRFVLRDRYHGENRLAFPKDRIHFFQRAVGRLGVEEVDDWKDERIASTFR